MRVWVHQDHNFSLGNSSAGALSHFVSGLLQGLKLLILDSRVIILMVLMVVCLGRILSIRH